MESADEYASLHDAYDACGPEHYYKSHGHNYRNPHEPIIANLIVRVVKDWPVDLSHVLDLAAGSGEATLAIRELNSAAQIDAIDPYTSAAYQSRTGQTCEAISFEQIAAGALAGRRYSLIACSFAMHLVDESRLARLCWALSEISPQLLILTPHKRPILREEWGWKLSHEQVYLRVRARLYQRVGDDM